VDRSSRHLIYSNLAPLGNTVILSLEVFRNVFVMVLVAFRIAKIINKPLNTVETVINISKRSTKEKIVLKNYKRSYRKNRFNCIKPEIKSGIW
jgi:hypothetical protein